MLSSMGCKMICITPWPTYQTQHLHISRLLLLKHIRNSAIIIQGLMSLCSIFGHLVGVFLILHFYLLIILLVLNPWISYSSLLADCSDDLSVKSHLELVKGQLVQCYCEQYLHDAPPPTKQQPVMLACNAAVNIFHIHSKGQLHSPIQAVTQSNSEWIGGVFLTSAGRLWDLWSTAVVGWMVFTVPKPVSFCLWHSFYARYVLSDCENV